MLANLTPEEIAQHQQASEEEMRKMMQMPGYNAEQMGQMHIEGDNQFQHMDNHQLEKMLKDYAREPKLK